MTEPKRRGRKPGVKTGPRVGSRPHTLLRLEAGESVWFEVPAGATVTGHMQQIQVDISRNGLTGKMTQSLFLAIQPTTREVINLVRVTRLDPPPDA